MNSVSPRIAYHSLRMLESGTIASSARYRELALEVLADPDVSLSWRRAIADRLNHANNLLTMLTVHDDDSY